ncbi:MAG: ABC transporter ATP-binding protein [Pseudomonadales bacterium]|nr:ABC transporter ATP-binding protein [Pseudomonadales bacterium]
MKASLLDISQLACSHNGQTIIRSLNLTVETGTICGLLGPSGCGKTTILRAIAGFHPVDEGKVVLDGKTITSPTASVAPEKRGIGFVFQDYALFPHLTVAENILFGLKQRSGTQQQSQLREALALVGLSAFAERMPFELSGGQQQRVALARALAPEPRLLLLDEPFSNLDTHLRSQLSREVRGILKHKGITAILVTHDQQEAFAVADQIGVLDNGTLQQWDTPYRLYHEPVNHFVATFIGKGSFIPGKVIGPTCVSTELGEICSDKPHGHETGSHLSVLIRPDDITCDNSATSASAVATIIDKVFNGASTLYLLQLDSGNRIEALLPSHQNYALHERIAINLHAADHLIAFTH